jgi:hypothetical protein
MSYFKIAAYAAAVLVVAVPMSMAQAKGKGSGASLGSPGHEKLSGATTTPSGVSPTDGPGASGWAPGKLDKAYDGTTAAPAGPGASGYAPGKTK